MGAPGFNALGIILRMCMDLVHYELGFSAHDIFLFHCKTLKFWKEINNSPVELVD